MNQLQRLFTCLHTSKLDGFVDFVGNVAEIKPQIQFP